MKDPRFDVQIAATGAHLLKSHGSTLITLGRDMAILSSSLICLKTRQMIHRSAPRKPFAKCSVGFAQALDSLSHVCDSQLIGLRLGFRICRCTNELSDFTYPRR